MFIYNSIHTIHCVIVPWNLETERSTAERKKISCVSNTEGVMYHAFNIFLSDGHDLSLSLYFFFHLSESHRKAIVSFFSFTSGANGNVKIIFTVVSV